MVAPNQSISLEESTVETVAVVVSFEGGENDSVVMAAARKSACDSCASSKNCGVSALSGLFGKSQLHFKVPNTMDAKIGQAYVVGIPQVALLKMASIAYLVPLTLLLVGAIGASALGASDMGAAFGAVIGLMIGIAAARRVSGAQSLLNSATPKVLRPHIPAGSPNCHG